MDNIDKKKRNLFLFKDKGEQSSEEKNADGGQKKNYVALGVLSVLGLTVSTPAHAGWMSSLISGITNGITKTLTPIIETITNVMTGNFDKIMERDSSKIGIAVGASTDSINKTQDEIYRSKQKAATAPSPDHCKSDQIGAASTKAAANATAVVKTRSANTMSRVIGSSRTTAAKEFARQAEKYGSSGKNLQISAIYANPSMTTDDEVETAGDCAKLLLGPTVNVGNQDPVKMRDKNGDTAAAYDAQARIVSKSSRVQLAMLPFDNAIAIRDSRVTPSMMVLMEQEVARTYGDDGTGWRAEINAYSDPTPLMIESCRLMAFQNKLLLEQFKLMEQKNQLLGTQLLEIMESNRPINSRAESVAL